MIITQIFGNGYQYVVTAENVGQSDCVYDKISEPFRLEMEENPMPDYLVMIWLKDIDMETVYNETELRIGFSWEDIEAMENGPSEAVSEEKTKTCIMNMVDTYVMEERKISAEKYAENNNSVIENHNEIEVEFVSDYAPMILAKASLEEIYELCYDEMVAEIMYCEPEIPETQGNFDDSSLSSTASSVSGDEYLDYINASLMQRVGLSGDGIKVGMLETYRSNPALNSELSSSDIIQVGSGLQAVMELLLIVHCIRHPLGREQIMNDMLIHIHKWKLWLHQGPTWELHL